MIGLMGKLKGVAVVLSLTLLVGGLGSAAGAYAFGSPPPEAGAPDWTPRQPVRGEEGRPDVAPPPLTEEQEALLEIIRGLVERLDGFADDIGLAAAAEDWDRVEAGFLDYVATLVELERAVDAFVATLPEDRPLPMRVVLHALQALRGQATELAGPWAGLPEENRAPVREAVRAAAEASEHPRFWTLMIRLVRGEVRPVPVRERLERMLEKARADLESAERRAERIRERIAKLDDLIASTTDPGRLETLRDLRYLAELDLAVAEAKIARDRFAVEMLEKQLSRLEAGQS